MCCNDPLHVLGLDFSDHHSRAIQHAVAVHETADALASERLVPVAAAAGNDLSRLWDVVRQALVRTGVEAEEMQAVAALSPQSVGWMLTQMLNIDSTDLRLPPETLVVKLLPEPIQVASSARPRVHSDATGSLNLLILPQQDAVRVRATTNTGPLDEIVPAGGAIALRLSYEQLSQILVNSQSLALLTDLVHCVPAGTLHLSAPTVQRWSVIDAHGRGWFPEGSPQKYDSGGRPWFAAAVAEVAVPVGTYQVSTTRGVGWTTVRSRARVVPDTNTSVTLGPERTFDVRSKGWVSADLHVHMNYGGAYVVTPYQAALMQAAEDLDLLNLVAANHTGSHVYDLDYLESTVGTDITHHGDRTVTFGVEYRNDLLGHFETLGATHVIDLYQRGHTASTFPFDSMSNAEAARRYRDTSAAIAYAHPVFPGNGEVLDRVFDPASFEPAARESVCDALLGLVDSLDVMSNADPHGSAFLYRKLLSVGCRLAATAGTDVVLSSSAFATLSNPPGWARVFAQTASSASAKDVAEAIRAGRTMVTNGPWLELSLADAVVGDTISVPEGAALHFQVSWFSPTPAEIRLHLNQHVERISAAPGTHSRVWGVIAPQVGPITLELVGTEHDDVLGGVPYAHTSPLYVENPGRDWIDADAVGWCREWLDRLAARIHSHGSFDSLAQEQELLDLVLQARAVLDRRAL